MTVLEERPRAATRATGRRWRRAARGVSTLLILAGGLLVADAGLTVAWQEPLSALYARAQQDGLTGRLDALRSTFATTAADRRSLAALPDGPARVAFAARALEHRVQPGEPLGRLRIPAIGVSQVVVQGTAAGDLRRGPGHYAGTPLPGAPGTVGIAGHRTTYGAAFRRVADLRAGDPIVLQMPYATVTYRVEGLRIVAPTATWVVGRRSYDRLVLTACHPRFSAAKRMVVFARRASVRPSAALR